MFCLFLSFSLSLFLSFSISLFLFAACSLLLAACSLLFAPCSLLLAPFSVLLSYSRSLAVPSQVPRRWASRFPSKNPNSEKVWPSPWEKGEPPCGSQGCSPNSLVGNHIQKRHFLQRKPHIRGRLSSILEAKVYILRWSIFVVSAPPFFPLVFLFFFFSFLSFLLFFFSFPFFLFFLFFFFFNVFLFFHFLFFFFLSLFLFLLSGAQNLFFGHNCFTISWNISREKNIF